MRADGTEVAERHRANLEQFVLRARRVEAHSLAANWEALVALAEAPFSVKVLENGETRIRQEFPAEEVIESAAARVRPLLLEGEACGYLKALAGMGYFCRALPVDSAWVKAARSEWQVRTGATLAADIGYQVMVCEADSGQSADLDDRKLALAWIYGDVVHHDTERRREADPFGLSERFRAAVPLIAWIMICTIELLNYIRVLQPAGVLSLQPDVFEQEVVLKATSWEQKARMYSAPVGTPAPTDVLSPLGKGWTRISSAADLKINFPAAAQPSEPAPRSGGAKLPRPAQRPTPRA
ncbi:hypothetical protein [Streptomyces sp. AA1529]|uniref:hypothetical protein n=1 Tax=Streptomyces sp. AA1529 TaxID=1203257 RepID=UPI003D756FB3